MAKKSAAGSIRQRPDGRWEARVTVGTNPGTGKPIRRSLYGNTQKEVRQKMTTVLRELDSGTYQAPNRITVAEWMDEWLNVFCANKVKPSTYHSYQSSIRLYINPVIGAMPLQSVRGSHVQGIYNKMLDAGLIAMIG